jgi:hypothetical protein
MHRAAGMSWLVGINNDVLSDGRRFSGAKVLARSTQILLYISVLSGICSRLYEIIRFVNKHIRP